MLLIYWLPALLLLTQDQPLAPARSPNRQVVASTTVDQRFVAPPGADYCLVLNSRPVYPAHCTKHVHRAAYTGIHTFLSPLVWASDSRHLAFLEKVYDWEYTDPYNRYFDGTITRQAAYLVVVSAEGQPAGYPLRGVPQSAQLRWLNATTLSVNGVRYDITVKTPQEIP